MGLFLLVIIMDFKNAVTYDVECYINYFLVKFRKVATGEMIYFEMFNDGPLNKKSLLAILNKYTIISFNGIKYDTVVIEAALAGFNNETLKKITNLLIVDGKQPWQIRKQFGIAALQLDHIDIMEVAPLTASLKIYGGRLHTKKMQDLPIPEDAIIKDSDRADLIEYCGNDLALTEEMALHLEKELDLRVSMGEEYYADLRSKSDAQIAEQVIKSELDSRYDIRAKRPSIEVGTVYHYNPPANIKFQTPILQDILRQYTTLPFTVGASGHVGFNFELTEDDRIKSGKNKGKMPEKKSKLKFTIGDTKYTVGTGGLHSNEKKMRVTNEGGILRDYDVASYYPNIILNNKLAPKHLGRPFLEVYRSIVERRLKAKKEGNKVVNESLKITINGSFGKFGSKWSCLYSPDLMMQVTITGQLSLLMLIETLELAGIPVVSANTDGIVVKIPPGLESKCESIVEDWEFETNYEMEGSDYLSLNSRDVNNYIAIKPDGVKGKGAYSDQREHFYSLRTNPSNDICTEAAKLFLTNKTPLRKTIECCEDITKFVTIRTVNGGAIYEGQLIGKAIRWYYGRDELDAIYYQTNGNKVPKSDGGKPLMEIPEQFPSDVDFNWYVREAERILTDIGYKF